LQRQRYTLHVLQNVGLTSSFNANSCRSGRLNIIPFASSKKGEANGRTY
jgi:hypothetical protein